MLKHPQKVSLKRRKKVRVALQNRVQPDGTIAAHSSRGLFMGNRGGQFHNVEKKELHPTKRWATKQWICCVLEFKSRHKVVMGKGYTPLFFLDEVTALAAGHRPCFECRRADAVRFAECWQIAAKLDERPKVGVMDNVLHEQRLDRRLKRTHAARWGDLPDGAVVQIKTHTFARHEGRAHLWTGNGYGRAQTVDDSDLIVVLSPPAIVDVLRAGFTPVWHPTVRTGV